MKKLFAVLITMTVLLASGGNAMAEEVKVLLIGSHSRGINHWLTPESLAIENYLKFNGIDYTFFDIYSDDLTKQILDEYKGVILEGNSIKWDASAQEKKLITENMKAGNITVFLTCAKGEYADLNYSIYSALNISAAGKENNKSNIRLNGAKVIYNYSGEENFVFSGGRNQEHIGLAINCLRYWDYFRWQDDYLDERKYGLARGIEKWMNNAFGADVRVSMPLISLLMDDTQLQGTGIYSRDQSVLDWVDENKHRIRNSGYLVTFVSGHATGNKTLQSDEEILSRWGSMSLHGFNHDPVGVDDHNRDYSVQNEWTSKAVITLKNFSRFKPIQASPMGSFNNATLHAMYSNGFYYHVGSIKGSQEKLYRDNFDVKSGIDRKRMGERLPAGYGFYPLVNNNGTDTVRIYSLLRSTSLDANENYNMEGLLKQLGLDRLAPLLIATHYNTEAIKNPANWKKQMNDLMELVDHDSYQWRRWVDNYDLARNMKLYETNLSINSITVEHNIITYNITADDEIRYLTLKSRKEGHSIKSVTIDGSKYNYFGENYVHLPAINGTRIIEVTLTDEGVAEPHAYHIQPSGVIENTSFSNGLLDLDLSGEFAVNVYLDSTDKVFLNGINTIVPDKKAVLQVNVSNQPSVRQVDFAIAPSSESITVEIFDWKNTYKRWVEGSNYKDTKTEHVIGDFNPNRHIEVRVNEKLWNSYKSNETGHIKFVYDGGYTKVQFEAVETPSSRIAIIGFVLLIILIFWAKGRRK